MIVVSGCFGRPLKERTQLLSMLDNPAPELAQPQQSGAHY
jgi:hypothetical protein